MKYVRKKASGYYFEPSAKMHAAGFHSEPLGTDKLTAAIRAKALTDEWELIRTGGDPNAKPPPKAGSVRSLIEKLKGSDEWQKKSPARRDYLDYSFGVICDAGFGDTHVTKITPDHCQTFYSKIAALGPHARHDIYRDFRYLMNYACRLLYEGMAKGLNPTYIVENGAPPPRRQKWTQDQVTLALKKGWDEGYKGATVALALQYDTSMRAVDARKLPPEELDLVGARVMIQAQSKTDEPHWTTLWPETVKLIRRYLKDLGATPMPGHPILRTRTGLRYTRIQLSRDLRAIMKLAGMGPDVQARDLRRTAQIERAEKRATASELGAAAGQKTTTSQRIIDTYVPASFELAKSAQEKRGNKLRTKRARRA